MRCVGSTALVSFQKAPHDLVAVGFPSWAGAAVRGECDSGEGAAVTLSQKAARAWPVYCSQFASCRWRGRRWATTREKAVAKPCPWCGKQVVA